MPDGAKGCWRNILKIRIRGGNKPEFRTRAEKKIAKEDKNHLNEPRILYR